MNITKFLSLFLSLSILLLIFGAQVLAEGLPPRMPLKSGMTLGQVQALWGPPDDVVEKSLQNEVLWKYKAYKRTPVTVLRFQKGNLVLSDGAGENQDVAPIAAQGVHKSKAKSYSFMAVEDEKVLGEILSEVPNAPDGPLSPSSATSPAAAPALNPVEIE